MWEEKRKKVEAYFKARWKGMPQEDVSDFGAYCIELWLSGKGLRSQYKYLAIDFLRKHRKGMDQKGSKDLLLRPGRIPLPEEQGEKSGDIHRFEISDNLIRNKTNTIYRVVLILTYEWDFTLREIGHVLGVSESRVAQFHCLAIEAERGLAKPQKEDENPWEIIADSGLDEKAQRILRRIQAAKNGD